MLYVTSTLACLLLPATLESEDIQRNKTAGLPCSTVTSGSCQEVKLQESQVLKSLLLLCESAPPEDRQSPAASSKKLFPVCATNFLLISAVRKSLLIVSNYHSVS